MDRKHIWVFYQDGGTPAQGWGDRHYFLAKNYDPAKYLVTIFSANDSHMFSEPVRFNGNYLVEQHSGVKYCWVKINSYKKGVSKRRILSWFVFAWKLFFIPVQKIGRPDIVIVSSMPIFPILPALFYKLFWKAKLIFEVRDIWPLTIIEMEGYSLANPFIALLRLLEKIAYRSSDFLVSVLDEAHRHFTASIGRSVRFKWISNGIDQEILSNDAADDEVLSLIPENKFIVGYAGKMSVSNAVEFIVAAASILSHENKIHFVFMGDGDHRLDLIEQSRHLNNVTFIPKIKKHLVHQVLKKFSVAIISFRKLNIYQFGVSTNKLFDYMMAELPIIMAAEHRHDAYYSSGAIIQIAPENPTEIAKTVLLLSQSPRENLTQMGLKGREYALNNFLYRVLARRYEQVFQQLVCKDKEILSN